MSTFNNKNTDPENIYNIFFDDNHHIDNTNAED